MRHVFSVTLLLMMMMMVVVVSVQGNKRAKNHKGAKRTPPTDCSPEDVSFGKCVPDQGDCGDGLREAKCLDRIQKIPCRVPCNWKKDISDCKYKFSPWGSCDPSTNTKSRSGSLKKALFNAECQSTVKVSKPCSPKAKKSRGETEN
ncbi:unnamed protein product [Ophioblennius macclurei]